MFIIMIDNNRKCRVGEGLCPSVGSLEDRNNFEKKYSSEKEVLKNSFYYLMKTMYLKQIKKKTKIDQ